VTAENGRYVSASHAAAILHVGRETVSRWARAGKLPYQRTLGGHRRYPEARLRELAASLREEVRDEPEEATA
jgi:excisionase family DNA binding protein